MEAYSISSTMPRTTCLPFPSHNGSNRHTCPPVDNPPKYACFSTRMTFIPCRAAAMAATTPPGPPPTTMTSVSSRTGISRACVNVFCISTLHSIMFFHAAKREALCRTFAISSESSYHHLVCIAIYRLFFEENRPHSDKTAARLFVCFCFSGAGPVCCLSHAFVLL